MVWVWVLRAKTLCWSFVWKRGCENVVILDGSRLNLQVCVFILEFRHTRRLFFGFEKLEEEWTMLTLIGGRSTYLFSIFLLYNVHSLDQRVLEPHSFSRSHLYWSEWVDMFEARKPTANWSFSATSLCFSVWADESSSCSDFSCASASIDFLPFSCKVWGQNKGGVVMQGQNKEPDALHPTLCGHH